MSKPIHLGPRQAAIVERLVSAGRYASADEAVREAVKLLDAHETRLSDLREAWLEGVASGDYEPIETTLDDLSERYAMRVGAAM